jgi:hypothetical protein
MLLLQLFVVRFAYADPIDPFAFANNGQKVTINSFGLPANPASDIRGFARAQVGAAVTLPCGPVAKAAGQACNTGAATVTGTVAPFTVAQAQTVFQTSGTPTNIVVGTAGTFAQVNAGAEYGLALVNIADPAYYDDASGHMFGFTYGLLGGFGLGASLQGLLPSEGLAAAQVSARAGSNIPGLETFFSWTLALNGSDPSQLSLNFSSNPLLGLNDALVRTTILSNLVFDAVAGSYTLPNDLDYASFMLTVANGQDNVAFTWDTNAQAEAATIPEPSTLALVCTGMAGLIRPTLRKRQSRASA